MAVVPINPDLQKSYRDTLEIPEAPSFIDTQLPILPVAIVANSANAANAQSVIQSDGSNNITDVETVKTTAFRKGNSNQEIINVSTGIGGRAITAGTGYTAYTVTTGKTFYMTSLTFSKATITGKMICKDGSTNKICAGAFGNIARLEMSFPVPIKFETNVFFDLGASDTVFYSFSGWEE